MKDDSLENVFVIETRTEIVHPILLLGIKCTINISDVIQ